MRTDGPPASSSLQIVSSPGALPVLNPDRAATQMSAVLIGGDHRTVKAALGLAESSISRQVAAPGTAAIDVIPRTLRREYYPDDAFCELQAGQHCSLQEMSRFH
jgi:hypothetical protein